MRVSKFLSAAALLTVTCALVACDVSTPSKVYTGQIRVKEEVVAETLDARMVDRARVGIMARHLLKNGKGPVMLTVSYLEGETKAEETAQQRVALYQQAFEDNGVSDTAVSIVPVSDRAHAEKIVIAYQALTALPAKDCNLMPGNLGAENISSVNDYRFGCDTQKQISKMVADPSDLLGKGGSVPGDSRRVGGVLENYKSGVPNERMEGMNASEVGRE